MNYLGDIGAGMAGGPGSYWLKTVAAPVVITHSEACVWIDTNTLLMRMDESLQYQLQLRPYPFAGVSRTLPTASAFFGGGGNFGCTLQANQYPSFGLYMNQPLPAEVSLGHLIIDGSRDGALLFLRLSDGAFVLLHPSHPIPIILPPGQEARIGDGGAIVRNGPTLTYVSYTDWSQKALTLIESSFLNKPAINGKWVSYAVEDAKGVNIRRYIHPMGSTKGWRILGPGYSPDMATIGTNALYLALSSNEAETPSAQERLVFTEGTNDAEMGPLEAPPAPAPPPPIIVTPPQQETHMDQSIIDHINSALTSLRDRYGLTMTNNDCVEFLNRAAYMEKDDGWGLLLKPSGNNGQRSDGALCSVDYLVFAPTGEGFDVLSDAGGASRLNLVSSTPSDHFTPDRIVAPISPLVGLPGPSTPPPATTPQPPPQPASSDPVATLLSVVTAMQGQIKQMALDIEHLISVTPTDEMFEILMQDIDDILHKDRTIDINAKFLGPLHGTLKGLA